MRTYNLAQRAPLYRSTVGFDQIVDLMDRVLTTDVGNAAYPPYNIEKTGDDAWRISIAVAGFGQDDLTIEQREKALLVTGRKAGDDSERQYLHRGIATRAFERRFHLADHVRVTEASQKDGMLHIDLVREVPEALKPRRIEIAKLNTTPLVEAVAVN